MKKYWILLIFISSCFSVLSQETVSKVELEGKSYWVYPYRFDTRNDHFYSYDSQIGAEKSERDVVPYPGTLPDGDYIMYYSPISKYKKKMWFFHRRGGYYNDTTVIAVIFTLKNNEKQGSVKFYSIYNGLTEEGNYLNDQKNGIWKRKSYRTFYSNYMLTDEDEYEFVSGTILELITYKEGIREGKYRSFMKKDNEIYLEDELDSSNLILYSKGNYKLNKESGAWSFYYKNKSLFKKFLISDSSEIILEEDDEFVYSYSVPRTIYHNWYEIYYSNGQLQNRILYNHGDKVQLDSGYYSNGRFSWVNTTRKDKVDTNEIVYNEYLRFDSLGNMESFSFSKDGIRQWMKTYQGKNLCSEIFDRAYYDELKNLDTLVVSSIYYDCNNSLKPNKINYISYYHPETGINLNRDSVYSVKTYYEEPEDFEFKSDTASHIYYVTDIVRRGQNREIELRTYKHYYRGPYYNFYGSYTTEIDSLVLFKDGKRFTGDYIEYQGRWKKKMGKVKGNDHKLKYFSYYYAGRGFSGTPSFGYNSNRLVVSDFDYRGFGGKFSRKITSTNRGQYQNGLQEGKWTNENKRRGYLNEVSNYGNGQLQGKQLNYLFAYADRWSNCVDIVDKKISKKKRLFHKYRYYLATESNYQNDLMHGNHYSYYCNGQLSEKSYYENDLQNGEMVVYNEFGNMTKKANYNAGYYDGKYMEWSMNKKPRYDFNYEEGVLVGEYKAYHFSGDISLIGNLSNGYKIGDWYTYFEEGNVKYKDIYSIEDSTYMSFFSYYYNGAKPAEHISHNLNSCYSMQYYPSGTLAAEGKIVRNSRTGVWKFYDEGGNQIRQINYEPGFILQPDVNGKQDTLFHFGYYESWYTNGNKQAEAYVLKESTKFDCYQEVNITLQDLYYLNYWDRENVQTIKDKTGRLKSYHLTTGRPESEGEMINGRKNGYWRYWDPEGKLNGVGNFKNDLHEGKWLYGDLEGMHYLDDACFDISDPRVKQDMDLKKKQLSITEIIYLKGKAIKETNFAVDLNR